MGLLLSIKPVFPFTPAPAEYGPVTETSDLKEDVMTIHRTLSWSRRCCRFEPHQHSSPLIPEHEQMILRAWTQKAQDLSMFLPATDDMILVVSVDPTEIRTGV